MAEQEKGRGPGDRSSISADARVRDPVCGMQLQAGQVHGQRQAGGATYYFCSNNCLSRFDKDPGSFTRPPP
ncbi:MAG: YHS domain-containing protein [Deltaproteobacteria bacterium]|nr:YHS domain-containing protein [Deltaproteobacteria bacterium]